MGPTVHAATAPVDTNQDEPFAACPRVPGRDAATVTKRRRTSPLIALIGVVRVAGFRRGWGWGWTRAGEASRAGRRSGGRRTPTGDGSSRQGGPLGLALVPGEIVSTDRLVDIVWGDAAPATAATTLQSHVSRLRRVLGERAGILARPPGYVLDIGAEATDVQAAQRLIRQGTESPDPGERDPVARRRRVVARPTARRPHPVGLVRRPCAAA